MRGECDYGGRPTSRSPPCRQDGRFAARGAAEREFVLDEFMASIEREVIERAMSQAGGNKTAAAELLGMTRPRLYRRLVQLGLVSESAIEFHEDTSQ